ncbi:MAG: hypothetical protein ABSF87_10155 [Xanthobacteraceae bacterium]
MPTPSWGRLPSNAFTAETDIVEPFEGAAAAADIAAWFSGVLARLR